MDTREPVYTAGPAPSSHTSGVYTLTSSDQYTLSSSDQYAGASDQYSTPSEQYSASSEPFSNEKFCLPSDQVDGVFRDRSNSNVSNSGSFRGDGSDPTDVKLGPLSAEELSDLIVGRYPSCKSVSHTLDSDSDYVTLPSTYQSYVPVPPKRVDSAEPRFRPPPPPYPSQILKTDYDDLRDPPPYPENPTPVPPPVYPSEEATARFITTRSPNILTAHASNISTSSSPCYSTPNSVVPPIPPKMPRLSTVSAIISPNNYLDVAASKASVLVPCTFLPPPPPAPRQPPPPPPLATVYTSQLSRSQIEQYQQQMYSDVDFVVFPLKEPAISKQEYLEAKQGSLLAALAHTQPMFYRSTPYLGRYASSQNLSDTYVQLPVYGAPSISSTGSLDPPPPPLPPTRSNRFMRTRSDDNILNSLETPQPPKFRRLPPPPPPLPDKRPEIMKHSIVESSPLKGQQSLNKPISPEKILSEVLQSATTSSNITITQSHGQQQKTANGVALDIKTLREKSKKMDLPLISALCNDRSLLKQTKAFVLPKHPSDINPRLSSSGNSARNKYPVSGLSSTRINKPARKPPVSHRHPGDKLPEIPTREKLTTDIPRATPNNYVLTDPRAKHKTMQSHS